MSTFTELIFSEEKKTSGVFKSCFYKCVFKCFLNALCWMNRFSHIVQVYGRSPPWILIWSFNVPLWLNRFSQVSHKCHTECTRKWRVKFLLSANLFSQISQVWGLYTVCVCVWRSRCAFSANDLLHIEQMWGFSPVWTFWCLSRLHCWENKTLQTSH